MCCPASPFLRHIGNVAVSIVAEKTRLTENLGPIEACQILCLISWGILSSGRPTSFKPSWSGANLSGSDASARRATGHGSLSLVAVAKHVAGIDEPEPAVRIIAVSFEALRQSLNHRVLLLIGRRCLACRSDRRLSASPASALRTESTRSASGDAVPTPRCCH